MTILLILLMITLVIPLVGVVIWFVHSSKRSDREYERAIEEIYRRKRK